jgi:DNA invertase Pin-like site-specific DNA recombinase
MTNNPRVAIYIRVSTKDQSTALQLSELTQYLDARGWSHRAIYEDVGSGTNSNRAQLRKLLEDANNRTIDLVICWKLDRLFRSLKDLVTTLQNFNDVGVSFISLKDQIDITTASGRLLTHLLAAFGEFEAALIRERVRAGLNEAKRKGIKLGRPRIVNPESVFILRSEGHSMSQISDRLNISKSAVHKTLSEKPRIGAHNLLKSEG